MSWPGSRVFDGLLRVLYPPVCVACGQIGTEPFCRHCGEALLLTRAWVADIFAFALYGGPLRDALHALKFRGRRDCGRALGRWAGAMMPTPWAKFSIIPVPLGSDRLKQRGYNQSQVLARHMGRCEAHWLSRVRETAQQVGLSRAQRLQNVRGAFHAHPEVRGRSVVLLDDVVTTGATLRAARAALLAAGAEAVLPCALARADGFGPDPAL